MIITQVSPPSLKKARISLQTKLRKCLPVLMLALLRKRTGKKSMSMTCALWERSCDGTSVKKACAYLSRSRGFQLGCSPIFLGKKENSVVHAKIAPLGDVPDLGFDVYQHSGNGGHSCRISGGISPFQISQHFFQTAPCQRRNVSGRSRWPTIRVASHCLVRLLLPPPPLFHNFFSQQ